MGERCKSANVPSPAPFHAVVVSEDLGLESFNKVVIDRTAKGLGIGVPGTIFVGAHPDGEIAAANDAGAISVRVRKGNFKLEKASTSQPKHEISKLSEILELIQRL